MKVIKYNNQPNIKKDISYLYCRAFPVDERPPAFIFFRLAKKNCNKLITFYEKDVFIGFVLLTFYKKFCYISYLAVNKEIRNKGYGSQILSLIKDKYRSYNIFLLFEEVDSKYKDNDLRERRHQFYLRNGFKDNDLKSKEYGVIYQSGQIGDFLVTFEDYKHVFTANYGRWAIKYLERP